MFSNSGINKVFLIGTINKQPELLDFQDQLEMLCFPLVTNEVIKKNGEDIKLTEFHNIKVPKDVVETANLNLQIGQLIHIEGKIQTRSFYDDDKLKKYKLEIIVIKLQILNAPAAA